MNDHDNEHASDADDDKDDDKDEACGDGCHAKRTKPMPKLWQNPQVVTAAAAGALLVVGYVGSKLGLPSQV